MFLSLLCCLFSTEYVNVLGGICVLHICSNSNTPSAHFHFASKQQFKCFSALLDLLTSGWCELEWEEFAILGAFLSRTPSLRKAGTRPAARKRKFRHSTHTSLLLYISHGRRIKRATAREHSWAPPRDVWRRAEQIVFRSRANSADFLPHVYKLKYPPARRLLSEADS